MDSYITSALFSRFLSFLPSLLFFLSLILTWESPSSSLMEFSECMDAVEPERDIEET